LDALIGTMVASAFDAATALPAASVELDGGGCWIAFGFIGAGNVAQAIARCALAQGHKVIIGSRRGPQALVETVAKFGSTDARAGTLADAALAEMVVLAVPWPEAERALADAPAWNGRVLIDATNPFASYKPELRLADLGGRSSSSIIATYAYGARVVKAFNSVTMANFQKGPRAGDARRLLFVSGNDADTKQQVTSLVEGFGYAVIDLGDLESGGLMQQAGGPLAGKDLLLAG
jgi:8-hydroxy-5-deazaflavin:NADPH oxidoreductase